MDKVQKKILITMIIVVIIIVILLSIINQSKNNMLDSTYSNITESLTIKDNEISNDIENIALDNPVFTIAEDENPGINKIKNISNRTQYFTIKTIVNNYISYIGYNNEEMLDDIVSKSYISQYNINDITAIANVPRAKSGQHYENIITKMLTAQIHENQYIYIVNGNGRIIETNSTFNFSAFVRTNEQKNLYEIYPFQYIVDKGYNTLKIGDMINCEYNEIEENENNKLLYLVKSDLDMAKEYFNNYNELLLYYKENAYEKLDKQYSIKRFGNLETFKQYLSENENLIKAMEINNYKVISKDNYIDYICSDQYNNIYVFRQQGGIMKYSVFLDNYTVMLDEYAEEYNKLDKFDKGKYNLTKFINMVNTKDYNAIYNVLDTTFRTNNFKTLDNLKQFVQKNMYDLNSIEIEDIDNKTYEYYVFNCKITNMRNNNESKNMTIIINQTEGTEFTMSFSFE